jgi:hypothetical protein
MLEVDDVVDEIVLKNSKKKIPMVVDDNGFEITLSKAIRLLGDEFHIRKATDRTQRVQAKPRNPARFTPKWERVY